MVAAENGLQINEDPPRTSLFKLNTLAYELPGMDAVDIVNITYARRGDTPLTLDIYYPPALSAGERRPVVIFGLGYRMSKQRLRNEHFYTSWGKLVAAGGMVGVVYDTEQPDEDLEILMAFLRENAAALRIDDSQVGFMATSANGPTVMSTLMQPDSPDVRFAVYYYSLSLTPDGRYTDEFAAACQNRGCLVEELAGVTTIDPALPVFIVKAGQDFIPHINEGLDHFAETLRAAGAPVTVVNYADGVHGFDTQQRTEESARIIAETVDFMRAHFDLDETGAAPDPGPHFR